MYTYNITKHCKLYAFFPHYSPASRKLNHYQYLPFLLFCKNCEIQTDKPKQALVISKGGMHGRDPSKHWYTNGHMLKRNCDRVLVLAEMWYLYSLGRGVVYPYFGKWYGTVLLWGQIWYMPTLGWDMAQSYLKKRCDTVLLWEEVWYISTLRRHMVHPYFEKRYATSPLWEEVRYIPTLGRDMVQSYFLPGEQPLL